MFRKHRETHDQESKRLSEQAMSAQAARASALVKKNQDKDAADVVAVAVIPSNSISADAPSDAEISAATATERHVDQVVAPRSPSGPLVTLDNVRLWVTAGVKKANGLSQAKSAAIIRSVTDELVVRWPTS